MGSHATAVVLAAGQTATGVGSPSTVKLTRQKATFQATLANTTTPTATVEIQVSNDGNQWITAGTITLSGANDTDGFVMDAPWKLCRSNVTAISGTSAAVTVTAGV